MTEHVIHNSSHFQHWRLYYRYLGHQSLPVPQAWLLFWHGVLLLLTCLSGLESSQVLHRINSNAALSPFWQQLGQKLMLAPLDLPLEGISLLKINGTTMFIYAVNDCKLGYFKQMMISNQMWIIIGNLDYEIQVCRLYMQIAV